MNSAHRPPRRLVRPTRPPFTSSGLFTPALIALLCLILIGISWERGRGNFHRLTSKVLPDQPQIEPPTGPGGQEVVHLLRTPDAIGGEPEFISATLLPGRGMNLFQLTALIPGHGELPLLVSPPLAEAATMLTDNGPDANGALSGTMGGAFLVPWAGRLVGKPAATPGLLQTLWLGQRLTFPAEAPGSTLSTMGLLLDRGADSVHSDVILDGQSVEATFHPGTFSGNWPAPASVHVLVELSGHTMDLTVTVQNSGGAPMPVGVGWLPYFAIPSRDRSSATLTVPSSTRLELNRSTGLPTGRTLPVTGTPLDFERARGTRLGNTPIDDTFVHLSTAVLATGPIVELRDTTFGYGIRVLPLTANIKALHIIAPPDKPWVAIGPDMNFDDPLGSQWQDSDGSGIFTLRPGDSVQWKVRVEIFTFTAGETVPST